MTSITQTGGNGVRSKSATFSYDSDGRLSGVTLQENGDTVAQSTYTYDDASELTDLNYVDGSNAPLAGYHWDYDAAGLVSDEYSLKDTSGTPASYAGWAEAEYNYDADAQLSTTGSTDAVTYAGSWNSAVSNTSVTYDANGNRTSTDGTNTASSTNEVLFDGQYCYQYDAAGNRIAQWVDTHRHPEGSPQPGDSDITTYTWDNANQLTEVTYQASYGGTLGTDVAYTYDALGRMVSRTDKLANTSEYYVYDGQNLALVLDAAGDVVEREFYAPAASSPLPGGDQGEGVLASEVGPATMGTQSVGTVDWYLPDNQGTVRDVVELSGTTTSEVDHIVYDGFGNITTQTTPSDQPRFTYDGMPFDSASGMYDDGVRNYAATDAVFASLDPISFLSGQTNLSEYCGNNPTNYTDPSGLAKDWWDYCNVFGGIGDAAQGVSDSIDMNTTPGNQPAGSQFNMRAELRRENGEDYRPGQATRPSCEFVPNGGHWEEETDGPWWERHKVWVRDDGGVGLEGQEESGGGDTPVNAAPAGHFVFYTPPSGMRAAVAGAWGAVEAASVIDGVANSKAIADAIWDVSADIMSLLRNCFPAGTLVATPRGLFPIETIKAGDEVWAYDLVRSEWVTRQVLQKFVTDHDGTSATITVADEAIEATFLHPFWVVHGDDLASRPIRGHLPRVPEGATTSGRWVDAGDIRVGDELLLRDGRILRVQAIRHQPYRDKVYNIHVDDLQCYAVGQNSVLVHNTNGVTQKVSSAITKINNILRNNFKRGPVGDVSGAVSDMVGNPIPKLSGRTYDHVQDLGNMLRGLRKAASALSGSNDPAAVAAYQQALQAIQEMEDGIMGAGL